MLQGAPGRGGQRAVRRLEGRTALYDLGQGRGGAAESGVAEQLASSAARALAQLARGPAAPPALVAKGPRIGVGGGGGDGSRRRKPRGQKARRD